MKKLLISSAVAASLFTTAGMAAIATDGTGSFLVGPGYFAQGTYSSDLKLVNTSLTKSVILRGVIREFQSSEEIDFIVILSPSDVWEGKIYVGTDGKVHFSSTDDSNYNLDAVKDVNLPATLLASAKALNRTFQKGYVEFYPIATYLEPSTGTPAQAAVIPKSTLRTRFDALVAATAAPALGTTAGNLVAFDQDAVAGYVTVNNTAINAAMTIPMTAFEDLNITTQVAFGTQIGAGEDTVATKYLPTASQTIIKNDLRGNSVTVPYENHGINDGIYLTFWADYNGNTVKTADTGSGSVCTQTRSYRPIGRDMMENREVGGDNYVSPAPATSPNNVKCEFATVSVQSILNLSGATDTTKYAKGMVQMAQLRGSANVNEGANGIPSFIATNPKATAVGSTYSYSWTYAPVDRPAE